MKRYEVIREIYNKCSGNQMRDVFFEEIETDNPASYVADIFQGYDISAEPEQPLGTFTFNVEADGLRQRISLTEI